MPWEKNCFGSSHTIGMIVYVAQAVEHVLAGASINKHSWYESNYQHFFMWQSIWTRVGNRLGKQTKYVRSLFGMFLYIAHAIERVLAASFGKNCVDMSYTIGIILYVAHRVVRVLAAAFKWNSVGTGQTIGLFLYVAQAVERVLAATFGNIPCWFESHYRHDSLCTPGSWTRVSSCILKQTVLVRVPLSACFFM